ncbi:conserved Plasmodium protein, unknown function [Plasmodium malariae]|uniref:Uncharacterized protein n=1 Tax=Plasmodium malariae TaxID=5858 RepID=A0A1C3K9V6_PLAMA|nr:conserved Plasmodium protein, unknown function [Plasmodium malariae]
MANIQNEKNETTTIFSTKEEDLFQLYKNRNTTEGHKRKQKIKCLNVLISSFLSDKNDVCTDYRPCKLDDNIVSYKEGHKVVSNNEDPNVPPNTAVGTCVDKGAYPFSINNHNDVLIFSKKNIDNDCFHLKKIQRECNKIYDNLKFYKVQNHDIHKFRPEEVDTDIIKLKHDLDFLEYNDYDIFGDKDSEKGALRLVQEKCKKIVQGLNFNCDSVDIREVIDILNVITTPDFDERLDKYKYLKLFINKYHYVYPYEDIAGLRKIRKYVKKVYMNKGKFYINENDISNMYLKTNLENIIKNEYFINNMLNLHIDNGKFWIQLVHNIWIPLIIENFNSTHNSFYSYLMNYENDAAVLDQYTFSRNNGKFYKFSHYIFTGILFCGVPSIYRLLMRLHVYKYIEIRINMILENNYNNIYNEVVISSLNYNIDIIRSLFPFFKEFINIDIEQIANNFLESPFFNIVISSLKKENIEKVTVNQKYLNFINSFFLMITEFLYGIPNKKCIEKINENKIKLFYMFDEIFYGDMNILIGRDILLFIADLLCLYKLSSIYIKKKYCEIILNATNTIKNIYYNKGLLIDEKTWKQVYVIAVKINHFIDCALQRKQTINDNVMLQELTLINRYYFNNLKQENSLGEFYFLKNINYGIYCWNSVCNKFTNIHSFEYNQNNFEYCHGCYIATYCSEQCRLTHLLSSHHNVCVYFKNIPSFLKFNTFNVDYNYHDMRYLNIFQHIDTFDKKNEKYKIIY